jgi:hypothetical protein
MLGSGPSRLTLRLAQSFIVAQEDDSGPWRLRVVSYNYAFDAADGHEVLAFHWHPSPQLPITSPHLHLGAASGLTFAALQTAHIPTGEIRLDAIIRFAIRDLRVRPLKADWRQILDSLSAG